MKTDFEVTGKLYTKLDSYTIDSDNNINYFGSSNQFKTCKAFKAWLTLNYERLNFKVNKAS